MDELTPAEQEFFATGQLPAELQQQTTPDPVALAGVGESPAPVAPAVAAPIATPASPATPTSTESSDVAELLRRSLAEAQQRAANLEAQVVQLAQARQQPIEQPAPDPNVDPLGAMMHQIDSVNKRVLELQNQLGQQNLQQNQLAQFQQFKQHVEVLRDQFTKATPDFYDAYNHLRTIRAADLRNVGLAESQIQQTLLQDEVAISEAAIRNGRNPAQVVYDMAKQHGYAAKAQSAPAPTPSARLQNIQQSPTPIPPATPIAEDLSLDALKHASDADLNKLVLDPNAWSKIVGKDQYPL